MNPKVKDQNNPASDEFSLGRYLFYLIAHVDSQYGIEMEKVLQTIKIERTQWQILLCLREDNPSSISELSSRSGKKLSTVSRVIERMSKEGLVKCAPRKSDQRVTEVFLLEKGEESLKKVIHVASKQYERAIEGFSEEEVEQLRHSLKKVLQNLNRSPFI